MNAVNTASNTMAAYRVGDIDHRPWGSYKVTKVGVTPQGEEYCEKEIIVNPGQILSLQSHKYRREIWTVQAGVLTAILDNRRIELYPMHSIQIPQGSLHCMANLGSIACFVHERQEGLCREEDIQRYGDAYSRDTELLSPEAGAVDSMRLYNSILNEIKEVAA